ncbi:MAG TPA: serine hydrolase, partial [Ruminococcaceae bacterium]|nr:serine hydrolase [Oscillospiraceae bacterium]
MLGFSNKDIKNIDNALKNLVDENKLPMASGIVLRNGEEVYRGYYGYCDIDNKIPLKDDTIFRVFSMTKVITAVAMMKLFEQGKFGMDDPVYEYLPGFKNQKVLFLDENGNERFEPVKTPNTIRTMLTMTSGIPYYHAGRTRCADHMHELYKYINNSPYTDKPVTTVQAANLIGENPLEFHPGEGYQYGLSIDVIGGIIEVISGKRLGDFCREEIFEPLGMKDTDYYVHPESLNRLSCFYQKDSTGKYVSGLTKVDDRQLKRPAFEEGGDGIVTTTRDYAKFAQMLLNGGTYNGCKILGRKTVEYMSRNHITAEQSARLGATMSGTKGYGYGLGVRVMINPAAADIPSSLGEWGWYGKGGSWFCIDPAENMVIVFNTQDISPNANNRKSSFVAAVYA